MSFIDYEKIEAIVSKIFKIDYDKLSEMTAEKMARRLERKTLTRREVEMRIGFAADSSAARTLMKDPHFPKPVAFSENGHDRWFTKDIDNYMEEYRIKRSRQIISAA